jgi:thymidylate synthase (FAD)|tara:strand:+ start:1559 stop:2209 length:651 start_codon:yes stop_codon:yes gene_type:complete
VEVKFIDKMGSDLSVVNAARVSFAKTSDWDAIPEAGAVEGLLSTKDEGLIKYLAKHNHWSPFGHASMQIHVKAPIFVARQLVKHQVGLVWNEVSRRYVDDEPEFYEPKEWRLAAENKKQGSSNETIKLDISSTHQSAKECYNNMLDLNIAPEMARMVLPQSMYTEWYWSGSLMAFARVCNLRCKPDTQLETQMVANQIDKIGEELFPYSWEALRDA